METTPAPIRALLIPKLRQMRRVLERGASGTQTIVARRNPQHIAQEPDPYRRIRLPAQDLEP